MELLVGVVLLKVSILSEASTHKSVSILATNAIITATRYTFGLTVMGFRYFPSEHVGVNFDMSIGKPYALAFGVVYKL